jgi:hypothetical protein
VAPGGPLRQRLGLPTVRAIGEVAAFVAAYAALDWVSFLRPAIGAGYVASLHLLGGAPTLPFARQLLQFWVGDTIGILVFTPERRRCDPRPSREADDVTKERLESIAGHWTERHLEHLIEPVALLLVPIFFVTAGLQVRLELLASTEVLIAAGAIAAIAGAGKLLSGAAAGPLDRRLVGWGMVPRGEVGLIFAFVGNSLGVVDEEFLSVTVVVVLLTTLVTPPVLADLLARRKAHPSGLELCASDLRRSRRRACGAVVSGREPSGYAVSWVRRRIRWRRVLRVVGPPSGKSPRKWGGGAGGTRRGAPSESIPARSRRIPCRRSARTRVLDADRPLPSRNLGRLDCAVRSLAVSRGRSLSAERPRTDRCALPGHRLSRWADGGWRLCHARPLEALRDPHCRRRDRPLGRSDGCGAPRRRMKAEIPATVASPRR